MKAFFKIKTSIGSDFDRNVELSLKLFYTLVKPILLYASDFWGCMKIPKNNPIKNLQQTICKQIENHTKIWEKDKDP